MGPAPAQRGEEVGVFLGMMEGGGKSLDVIQNQEKQIPIVGPGLRRGAGEQPAETVQHAGVIEMLDPDRL